MVRNPELLRQMLEAVLHVKVADFTIPNPEVLGNLRSDKLKPTYSVVWTVPLLVPQLEELHSVFMLRDADARAVLSEHFQVHLLQLANLHCALHDPGAGGRALGAVLDRTNRRGEGSLGRRKQDHG